MMIDVSPDSILSVYVLTPPRDGLYAEDEPVDMPGYTSATTIPIIHYRADDLPSFNQAGTQVRLGMLETINQPERRI